MSSNNEEYNPNSMNAIVSRILERMDQQDEFVSARMDQQDAVLNRVEANLGKYDSRTTALERWKDVSNAKAGAIGGVVAMVITAGAWLWDHLFSKHS